MESLTQLEFYGVVAMAIGGVFSLNRWLFRLLEEHLTASIKHLFFALFLFVPLLFYVPNLINKLPLEFLSLSAIVAFILSSLIGLSIFLLFLYYLFEKKIKKVFITLFMGGLLFPFFASSAYFTLSPIVEKYSEVKANERKKMFKLCEEKPTDCNCLQVAQIYIEGDGVPKNYQYAIDIYQKLSDNNSSRAMNKLGILYEEGKIVQQNFEKSTKYYKKSCDLNDSKGCIKLAESYYRGRGVTENKEKAESTFFNYCLQGYERGCNLYLEIHGRDSNINYSTYKESGKTLEDDPSIWSRVFDTPQPKNITILKSKFKSNYSWCCTTYNYYLKFKMSKRDREVALGELQMLKRTKESQGSLKGENDEVYKIFDYDNTNRYLSVDKQNSLIYIYGDGYIDGR